MSKPEVLTGRKDGKTRRNAVKHNKECVIIESESPFDCCEQDNRIERLHALTPFKTVLAPPSCLGFFIGINHEKNRV